MKLFTELVLTAPIRARLQFGINENVILEKVDFNERKNKGLTLKMHTFITLVQIDAERKVVARSEGNFFNLDHTSDYVYQNFMDEFTCQAAIVDAIGGDLEAFDEAVTEVFGDESVEAFLKTKQGSVAAQEALADSFMESISGRMGDDSPILACKMVSNKAGWLEFPKEMGWIVPQGLKAELPEITSFEKKRYQEGLAAKSKDKAKPDGVGSAPGAKSEKESGGDALSAL